jgi:multimeric flavodoxin WrbA/protein-tyrosine-phosphatase
MFVLGLQGSPRLKGNTQHLLALFMAAARQRGAETLTIDVDRQNILPCKEYVVCEKRGFCPIKDDMAREVYGLLRRADIVVLATPIFFYNMPAQLKALVDRSQTLWARKYRLKLSDPGRHIRRGFLLAVGATRGKQLFEGLHLTAQYFFDAISASYEGSLTYREIEHPGDMAKHPTVATDVAQTVAELWQPYQKRPKVLFAGRHDACRGQMASAFTRYLAGDRFDALAGGHRPADDINADMLKVMHEKGIDMAFRVPQALDTILTQHTPDILVQLGHDSDTPVVPDADARHWDLADPAGRSIEFMRQMRDTIEAQVKQLIDTYPNG